MACSTIYYDSLYWDCIKGNLKVVMTTTGPSARSEAELICTAGWSYKGLLCPCQTLHRYLHFNNCQFLTSYLPSKFLNFLSLYQLLLLLNKNLMHSKGEIMPILSKNLDLEPISVCNNATWAIGEISIKTGLLLVIWALKLCNLSLNVIF